MFDMRSETLVDHSLNYLLLSDFNQTGMLVKSPNMKFNEDRFSGSRVVTDGWTGTHAETNGHTLQLSVANVPKFRVQT
jgi:hypothetical protein